MRFYNTPNEMIKTADGREVWISRSVAVAVILHRFEFHPFKRYVAISKRAAGCPDAVGLWCLPCGYLDWDETGEDAVIREVWEELGINVSGARPKFWDVSTDPSNNRQNVSLYYSVLSDCIVTETFKPNPDEVEEAVWMDLSDIGKYTFAFNHDKRIKKFFGI